MCVECDSKEPANIERGVPPAFKFVAATASNPELEYVKAITKGLNNGLPPGLKGKKLFSQIVGVRLTSTKSTFPIKFLEVVVITSNR